MGERVSMEHTYRGFSLPERICPTTTYEWGIVQRVVRGGLLFGVCGKHLQPLIACFECCSSVEDAPKKWGV